MNNQESGESEYIQHSGFKDEGSRQTSVSAGANGGLNAVLICFPLRPRLKSCNSGQNGRTEAPKRDKDISRSENIYFPQFGGMDFSLL